MHIIWYELEEMCRSHRKSNFRISASCSFLFIPSSFSMYVLLYFHFVRGDYCALGARLQECPLLSRALPQLGKVVEEPQGRVRSPPGTERRRPRRICLRRTGVGFASCVDGCGEELFPSFLPCFLWMFRYLKLAHIWSIFTSPNPALAAGGLHFHRTRRQVPFQRFVWGQPIHAAATVVDTKEHHASRKSKSKKNACEDKGLRSFWRECFQMYLLWPLLSIDVISVHVCKKTLLGLPLFQRSEVASKLCWNIAELLLWG